MAHENADPSALPPPVGLPSEEEKLQKAIEDIAPKRYRKQCERLYTRPAYEKLPADVRCYVLRVMLQLLYEHQMQRRVRGKRKVSPRTVPEPRIRKANRKKAYREACEDLEVLLRKIEEHPLVDHFCRAHMAQYSIEEGICPHERW